MARERRDLGVNMAAPIGRADYYAWGEQQASGRYERVNGFVVEKPRRTIGHSMAKMAIWRVLKDAVEAAGVDCQAYPSGVTVEIGEHTDYEPDAMVNAGPPPAPDDFAAPNPVVVVEVLANDERMAWASRRIPAYFSVPSVQHLLWIHAQRPELVLYWRGEPFGFPNSLLSRIVTRGTIMLDPPGIAIAMDDLYRDMEH
jgi:Uma2 family endonuclease